MVWYTIFTLQYVFMIYNKMNHWTGGLGRVGGGGIIKHGGQKMTRRKIKILFFNK